MQARNCNTGLLFEDFNTLDHKLDTPMLSGCRRGIVAATGDCLRVYGGSASRSGTDFVFGAGGTYSVLDGFRSENVGFKKEGETWAQHLPAGVSAWGMGTSILCSGG